MLFSDVKLVIFTFIMMSLTDIMYLLGCDTNCEDKPVFTPSRLVVQHRHPASATCVACKQACTSDESQLEIALGVQEKNGTTLTWRVKEMTEWDTRAMCFYTSEINGAQCCTTLPVTVYKPPQSVSIREVNDTWPMIEHGEYTLECTVYDVAPIEKVQVTFYKEDTELACLRSTTKSQKTPTTETFTLNINTTKEDDGARYWCRAELELEVLQPTSVSEDFNPTVYYGPYVRVPVNPEPIVITEGNTLNLSCWAEGNPPPFYTWTLPFPSASPYNNSTLTVASAGFEHAGQYICVITSNSKTVSVKFSVEVRVNIIPYVIAAAVVAVALVCCAVLMGYIHYYKNNKMGGYDLKDVFHFRSRHIALPSQEST